MSRTHGLRRLAAALATSVALVAGGLAAAAPASALSPVAYAVTAPTKTWVGDWVTLGLGCPTTCPTGVSSATVSVSGGPTLALPLEPDYTVSWQVQGITAGSDASPVSHTVTVDFVDETGSPRTLSTTVQVNKDSPQYVEQLVGTDGMDASVSWLPPLVDGGSPVTGYRVQVDATPWVSLASTARSFSLSGSAYGPHEVRVVAINAIGWGWGDPVTVLRGVLPSAPVVTVTGTVYPTITWTGSVGGGIAVTGYTVYSGGVPVRSLGADARSVTVTDLDPGAQDITVSADCWLGSGDESAPVEWVQASPPSPVSPPDVTAGNSSLAVSWLAPSDDGGLPVTSYEVRAIDPGTGAVAASVTTGATSVVVPGLLNQHAVLVQVAARNAVGQAEWTDALAAVAPNGPLPVATSVTVGLSDSTPSTRQKVTVRGTLAIAGRAATGQVVHVWVKPYGATAWSEAGTASASSTGAWSLVRVFARKTLVQARFPGSSAVNAAASQSAAVTVSPAIAVTARTTTAGGTSRSSFVLGSTVYVPVTTAGAPAGAKTKLQRKSGTSWVTVASASLVSGKARLRWKPTTRATYSWRVVVTGNAAVRTGISTTKPVRIVLAG